MLLRGLVLCSICLMAVTELFWDGLSWQEELDDRERRCNSPSHNRLIRELAELHGLQLLSLHLLCGYRLYGWVREKWAPVCVHNSLCSSLPSLFMMQINCSLVKTQTHITKQDAETVPARWTSYLNYRWLTSIKMCSISICLISSCRQIIHFLMFSTYWQFFFFK